MTRIFQSLVSKRKYIGKSVPTSCKLFGRQISDLKEIEKRLALINVTKIQYNTRITVLSTCVVYVNQFVSVILAATIASVEADVMKILIMIN